MAWRVLDRQRSVALLPMSSLSSPSTISEEPPSSSPSECTCPGLIGCTPPRATTRRCLLLLYNPPFAEESTCGEKAGMGGCCRESKLIKKFSPPQQLPATLRQRRRPLTPTLSPRSGEREEL